MTTLHDILRAHAEPKEKPAIPDEIEARVLRDLLPMVRRRCPFAVGHLVRQVDGVGSYTFGRRVAIVTHVFESPLIDAETNSAELRNDMLVVVRMGPNDMPQECSVQSWRFEFYGGPVA